ncbi:MAG: GatB/YqeY domain-containing protein [Bacteroidota bacterium]
MSLEQRILPDLKAAMKAKDQGTLRGIRAIKAAILLAKTDGSGKELDEAGEVALLQKLIKQRKDSLSIYEEQGREDLAAKEREEITAIEAYLPAQLSEDELKARIQAIIEKTGAEGMKDMGKVIGAARAELGGSADGKSIASITKQLLAG